MISATIVRILAGIGCLSLLSSTCVAGRFAFTAPDRSSSSEQTASFGLRHADVQRAISEAEAFARTGAWDQAVGVINAALDAFPDEPDLLIRAGHYYEKKNSYAVAESYWARLEELQPTNAWARACRGALQLRMGNIDEAEVRLRSALELDPSEMVARFHLACLHIRRGSNDAARIALGQLNLLETGQAATWTRDEWETFETMLQPVGLRTLGGLILSGGEPVPATTSDRVAALDMPGLRETLDKLARALWNGWLGMERKDWPRAVDAFKAASAAGYDAPAGYQGLAFSMLQSGERAKARTVMQRAVERFPESDYAWLKYGQLCLDLGDYAEAEKALGRARALDPGNGDALLGLAGALAAQGRMDEAWDAAGAIPPSQRMAYGAWFRSGTAHATALRQDRRFGEWLGAAGSESRPDGD